MKLVNVATMRAIEAEADQSGLTYELMMQNAGSELGRWVDSHLSDRRNRSIVGLVGRGIMAAIP